MTTLITDLLALTPDTPAERVRELNEQCLLALGWEKHTVRGLACLHEVFLNPRGKEIDALDAPNLLASVDDATAALPEGWRVPHAYWNDKIAECVLSNSHWPDIEFKDRKFIEGKAYNLATALTIANLKARALP